MTTQAHLDQITADIINQNICPDLAKTATNLVPGKGNPNADIVFIGEAPGKKEDLTGDPFVGAAGRFLDEMLATIQLKRSDIFITNIVKYRPPNNRDPLPEEKKAFLPFLQAQLEVIQPKIVVTLGRHSMNCFLPDLQISKIHGEPQRIEIAFAHSQNHQSVSAMQGASEQPTESYEGTAKEAAELVTQQHTTNDGQAVMGLVIMPLYHPAAALYNGGMRATLLEDFAKIPAIMKKIHN